MMRPFLRCFVRLGTTSPLTRLLVGLALLSLLALVVAVVGMTINGLQDPDGDGIPTKDDPDPLVFSGDLDADGDGWSNRYERTIGTDLTDPDQDYDGLLDGEDADGDGMGNWFERHVAHLDPLVPNHRYYLQLMSPPSSTVNETLNYQFWVEGERIHPEHFIVEYGVTLTRFRELIERLSKETTDQDLIYLYLRTHGAGTAEKPTLCFANESAPDQADQCGKVITYQELNGYLNETPCRSMIVVYSSCAGGNAVEILAKGRCPRMVATVMGITAGIPSVDAGGLTEENATGYFSAADLNQTIARQSTADCGVEERVSDRFNLSSSFIYGEYPRALYYEDYLRPLEVPEDEEVERWRRNPYG